MIDTDRLNHKRGEESITIDGQDHTLCLTLGALAELEETLGQGSLAALQERLKSPRIHDVLLILHALLRGGGAGLTLEVLKASNVDFGQATRAIAAAFRNINTSTEKHENTDAASQSQDEATRNE